MRKNLTLTFALRAEHQSNITCQARCFVRFAVPLSLLATTRASLTIRESLQIKRKLSRAWIAFFGRPGLVSRGNPSAFHATWCCGVELVSSTILFPGHWALCSPAICRFKFITIADDNLSPGEVPSNLFQDALNSNRIFLNSFSSGTLAQIQAEDPNFSPPAISSPEGRLHAPQYLRWSLEFSTRSAALRHSASLTSGIMASTNWSKPNANAFGFGSLHAAKCTSPPVPPCADPRFSGVTEFSSAAVSNYHGMVISAKHQFTGLSQGLLEINYTNGHAFDEVSNGGLFGFAQGSSIYPQDPQNLRGAYGPAEYDVRHSVNANYVWELPLKAALGGHGRTTWLRDGRFLAPFSLALDSRTQCSTTPSQWPFSKTTTSGKSIPYPWPLPLQDLHVVKTRPSA